MSSNQKLDNLKSLKVKLAEYNGFTKNKIENELNLSNLEYELETIKTLCNELNLTFETEDNKIKVAKGYIDHE